MEDKLLDLVLLALAIEVAAWSFPLNPFLTIGILCLAIMVRMECRKKRR